MIFILKKRKKDHLKGYLHFRSEQSDVNSITKRIDDRRITERICKKAETGLSFNYKQY